MLLFGVIGQLFVLSFCFFLVSMGRFCLKKLKNCQKPPATFETISFFKAGRISSCMCTQPHNNGFKLKCSRLKIFHHKPIDDIWVS